MTALWVALGLIVLGGLVLLVLIQRRAPAPSAQGLAPNVGRIYTTDAKKRMAQRSISKDQIESVLIRPDRVDRDDNEGSMRFERELGTVLLKVWVAADPWPPVDKVVVKTAAARHFGSLTIPAEAVGRVIGRGGATIKRIQETTSSKVVVKDDGSVQIRADARIHVERAHRMIHEIASNPGRLSGK